MCDCFGWRVRLAEHSISVSGRVEEKSPSSLSSHAYALTHTRNEVRERENIYTLEFPAIYFLFSDFFYFSLTSFTLPSPLHRLPLFNPLLFSFLHYTHKCAPSLYHSPPHSTLFFTSHLFILFLTSHHSSLFSTTTTPNTQSLLKASITEHRYDAQGSSQHTESLLVLILC